MTPLSGWIEFHRKTLESPVWNLSDAQLRVWLTCLLMANNTSRNWFDGTGEVEIPQGSFVTTQRNLAKKARVSRRATRGALEVLERSGSIRAQIRAHRYTVITIVNFDSYQAHDFQGAQIRSHRGAQQGPIRENERTKDIADAPPASASKGKKGGLKIHPETDPCIHLFGEQFSKKFEERTYQVEWGRDRKLMSGLLKGHGPEVVRELIPLFFRYAPQWVRDNGRYIIPVFRKTFNELQALKSRGDI